jgi:O-antigen/teichoic acid export membrane protein
LDTLLIEPVLEATASRGERSVQRVSGARAATHTLLFKILQQGVNAVTGIITARALMPEGRGQLAAMILWSQFLAGLTTFGLPASLIYYTNRIQSRRAEITASGLAISFLAGTVTMLVGIRCIPAWLHQYPWWLIQDARWFLILTPICSVTVVARAVLEANGQFSKSNLQQLSVPTLTVAGLLTALSLHHLTVLSAALCYTVPAIPAFVMVCVQLRPWIDRHQAPSLWGGRTLLTYGLRSWGIDLLGTMGTQIDQVLVIRLLTPADMGFYVVMLSLSRMLGVIQSSVVTVLFPKTTSLGMQEVVRVTGRAARISSLVTLFCGIVVGVAGPSLLRILYGKEYVHSLATFRVLLLEMLIGGATYVLSQSFMALGRPGLVTLLQALGLTLSVPAMLVLIPRMGVLGAAVALLMATTARFCLLYVCYIVVLKIRPPDLIPKREDFDYLLRLIGREAPSPAGHA